MRELVEAVRGWLAGRPIVCRPPRPWDNLVRPLRQCSAFLDAVRRSPAQLTTTRPTHIYSEWRPTLLCSGCRIWFSSLGCVQPPLTSSLEQPPASLVSLGSRTAPSMTHVQPERLFLSCDGLGLARQRLGDQRRSASHVRAGGDQHTTRPDRLS